MDTVHFYRMYSALYTCTVFARNLARSLPIDQSQPAKYLTNTQKECSFMYIDYEMNSYLTVWQNMSKKSCLKNFNFGELWRFYGSLNSVMGSDGNYFDKLYIILDRIRHGYNLKVCKRTVLDMLRKNIFSKDQV